MRNSVIGVIQVLVPAIVAYISAKGFLPDNQVAQFSGDVVAILVAIISAIWSAKTTQA
jgi:hypothetical protein